MDRELVPRTCAPRDHDLKTQTDPGTHRMPLLPAPTSPMESINHNQPSVQLLASWLRLSPCGFALQELRPGPLPK